MASERLQVILELVTGKYKTEAKEAARATGAIGDSAGGVTSKLGAMIGPAAIGGAIIGLGHMAVKAGENADRLFDLRAQTGLTLDVLQEWEFVAKTAGAGTEVFSDAVKVVIKNLNETEGATGPAGKAYETLGIKVLDASGKLRDAGDITAEVFDKLAGMENITARNALAQDIFGKKWEETISILDLGSDALANARGEAHEFGAVLSEDSLKGADAFRETWEKLKTTLSAKLMETLGKLGPTLVGIADAILEVVDAADPLVDFLPVVTEDIKKFADEGGGVNVLTAIFGGLSDELDDQLMTWDEAINRVILFGDEGLIALDKTGKVSDKFGEAGDRALYMADAVKDDVIPALEDLVTPIDGATRGLVDAQLAALAAETAFRVDLAGGFLAAALSIEKGSTDIGVSLDKLETRLLENITEQAAFFDNLIILADAGYGDLAEFLRGEGSDKVAGAAADLVLDLERASTLENLIDKTGRDAQRYSDTLAAALESDKTRLLDIAQSVGVDLAAQVEAGFSTLQLQDILGIALGAPGLGPVQGGTSGTKAPTLTPLSGTFHSGGIVPGPFGSEQMILARAGETVIPYGQSMGSRTSTNSTTININHPNTVRLETDLQKAPIYASLVNIVEAF